MGHTDAHKMLNQLRHGCSHLHSSQQHADSSALPPTASDMQIRARTLLAPRLLLVLVTAALYVRVGAATGVLPAVAWAICWNVASVAAALVHEARARRTFLMSAALSGE